MAQKNNLQPVQTKEEARERGRNGGIASGKARRAAKIYSDAAKALMASRFKTSCAGKELQELCKAFGFGEKETGAIMLALSDFMRGLYDGDKDSIDRLLCAAGVNLLDSDTASNVFESPNIIVLPSAKPGDVIVEEADGESS